MPDQEKGSVASLVLARETTWATLAAGNGLQLPIISVEGGLQQALSSSEALQGNRNPTQPFLDAKNVNLTVNLQPDVRSIGFVLCEIFGLPTTTGAGPYTHVFKVGSTLPIGTSLEKFFGVNSLVAQVLGGKWNGYSFTTTRGGALKMACPVVGADEVFGGARIDAAPYKYVVEPLKMGSLEVYKGGARTRKMTKFDMAFTNQLEEIETVGNDSRVGNILEGTVAPTGAVGFLLESWAEVNEATAGTEVGFKAKFPGTTAGHYAQVEYQEAQLAVSSPPIPGPGGINVEFDVIGFYTNGSEASSVVWTVVNDVPTYASIPA